MAQTAREYWQQRQERDARRAAAQAEARKLMRASQPRCCPLCGRQMTQMGGCMSGIGECPNAYTD